MDTGVRMPFKSLAKAGLAACVAVIATSLSGCGYDGVDLNGKIFDAVGMGTGSIKPTEPKLAARQPLVVPPGLDTLPPPGSGATEQPTLADIQDPDTKKKANQADLERQQAEYCKKNYEDPHSRGDSSADSAAGPLGSCHASIFSAVKKWVTPTQETGDEDIQTQ
jgi:hypothetical protein